MRVLEGGRPGLSSIGKVEETKRFREEGKDEREQSWNARRTK